MTRSLTAQHWVLAAVLAVWTAGSFGPAPALAQGVTFTGAGFAEDARGEFWYGLALAAGQKHRDTGLLVVQYQVSRDGLRTVQTDIKEIELIFVEGEIVGADAFGTSAVAFSDGRVEHRIPTMVSFSEDTLHLSLVVSDRAADSDARVVLGGNEAAPLPVGRSVLVAGVGVGLETGDRGAIGSVVSDEDGHAGRGVEGPACGRLVAAFDSDGGVVLVDAAPSWGEVNENESEFIVSGPATVDSPDGVCGGVMQLAGESGLGTLVVRSECAAAVYEKYHDWSLYQDEVHAR